MPRTTRPGRHQGSPAAVCPGTAPALESVRDTLTRALPSHPGHLAGFDPVAALLSPAKATSNPRTRTATNHISLAHAACLSSYQVQREIRPPESTHRMANKAAWAAGIHRYRSNQQGVSDSGKVQGRFRSTGVKPQIMERLRVSG